MVGISVTAISLTLRKTSVPVAMLSGQKIIVAVAMEKEYVKNEEFKPYLEQALTLVRNFDLFFIKWVPDTQNKAADALARKAIQKEKN